MQRKLKVYHIRVNVSIMKMTNQPFVIGIALMFYGCLANGHTRTINFIKTTDTLQLLHVVSIKSLKIILCIVGIKQFC